MSSQTILAQEFAFQGHESEALLRKEGNMVMYLSICMALQEDGEEEEGKRLHAVHLSSWEPSELWAASVWGKVTK